VYSFWRAAAEAQSQAKSLAIVPEVTTTSNNHKLKATMANYVSTPNKDNRNMSGSIAGVIFLAAFNWTCCLPVGNAEWHWNGRAGEASDLLFLISWYLKHLYFAFSSLQHLPRTHSCPYTSPVPVRCTSPYLPVASTHTLHSILLYRTIMSDPYSCSDLTDPNFNPSKQCITLFYPDATNITVPLLAMNEIRIDSIQWTIMFSTQIGACGILLIIFGLLTNPKKRKTALFICNMLALAFAISRAVLAVQWYLGPIHDIYTYMAADFTEVPMGARWASVASTTSGLALQIVIHIALILQLRVVYAPSPKLNMAVTFVACALALTSTGLFFSVTIDNNRANLSLSWYYGGWIYPASKIFFACCICFYCLIFLLKLGHAIYQRHILGLRSFGALQIIFTVGCQTMIIPGMYFHAREAFRAAVNSLFSYVLNLRYCIQEH
jgi:hypothetical protein